MNIKVIMIILSTVVSFTAVFMTTETVMRIHQKGFAGGLKSYFEAEPPYSVLGVSNWLISDKDLGYRFNPDQPGVNKYSMMEHNIVVPKPKGIKKIVIMGDSVPITGNPNFVDLLKKNIRIIQK